MWGKTTQSIDHNCDMNVRKVKSSSVEQSKLFKVKPFDSDVHIYSPHDIMEINGTSPFRTSSSQTRISSLNLTQLDKIYAIPNKTNHDSVLMSDLSPDDRHYINVLIDDSSSSDEDDISPHIGSTWSPMLQSPELTRKTRMKRLSSAYKVSLSLEDISYIRPSWGLSKGLRNFEMGKQRAAAVRRKDTTGAGGNSEKQGPNIESERELRGSLARSKETLTKRTDPMYYFMLLLGVVGIIMLVPPYLDHRKEEEASRRFNRLELDPDGRWFRVFRPDISNLKAILEVQFGLGIARNLRPKKCSCNQFEAQLHEYVNMGQKNGSRQYLGNNQSNLVNCFACLDWAVRSNFRLNVENRSGEDASSSGLCYNIKWQSYDSLETPIEDCFRLKEGQWLGLGDILENPGWPPASSQSAPGWRINLSADHMVEGDGNLLGAHVELTLLSTSGIVVGNLRTDFHVSLEFMNSSEFCIRAHCGHRCSRLWTKSGLNQVDSGRHSIYHQPNNYFEYQVCTAGDMRSLMARQVESKASNIGGRWEGTTSPEVLVSTGSNSTGDSATKISGLISDRLIERENAPQASLRAQGGPVVATVKHSGNGNATHRPHAGHRNLPEGIGLIERPIFATNRESLPTLDGQSLRQFVEQIVKLGLKTSPILVVDERWQTYPGSLTLDRAAFPRAKLLFEILHNKGFKIVLTVKPHFEVDRNFGSLNRLLELHRLYLSPTNQLIPGLERSHSNKSSTSNTNKKTHAQPRPEEQEVNILRRKSFYGFENETIHLLGDTTNTFPYLFSCREAAGGICFMLDITRSANRAWLVDAIQSSVVSQLGSEVDAIHLDCIQPSNFWWDDNLRHSLVQLEEELFYGSRTFVLPKRSGSFGYMELATRPCSWEGLRSVASSVINVSVIGYALVHPGPVWGEPGSGGFTSLEVGAELRIRWLQVAVFWPVLEFSDISPIEQYGLSRLLEELMKLRKTNLAPELKRSLPFTPLVSSQTAGLQVYTNRLPVIRPVWMAALEGAELVAPEQFTIGNDILVAPILHEGMRQRDIYLPSGDWRDQLRQTNIRGGKWLRNYPVELNEIAWFTRWKRR